MKSEKVILVALALAFLSNAGSIFASDKKPVETSVQGLAFPQMMERLTSNLEIWKDLNPDQKKEAVQASIALYKSRENTAILNTPEFYAKKIDETITGNSSVMNMSLLNVIKILAVMEYDFYNGQSKEELAKQVLGEKTYQSNRMRLQLSKQR